MQVEGVGGTLNNRGTQGMKRGFIRVTTYYRIKYTLVEGIERRKDKPAVANTDRIKLFEACKRRLVPSKKEVGIA